VLSHNGALHAAGKKTVSLSTSHPLSHSLICLCDIGLFSRGSVPIYPLRHSSLAIPLPLPPAFGHTSLSSTLLLWERFPPFPSIHSQYGADCCVGSPITVPAPTIHDLDYFPDRFLVVGTKYTGCLHSHACDYGGCPGHPPISRSSTPRGSTVSVRRVNTHPRAKPPYSHGRCVKHSKLQRLRSLTDMHASNVLAPSPLRYCAAYDEAGVPIPACVEPVSDLSCPRCVINVALRFRCMSLRWRRGNGRA
jgi:hypothetical protein